MRGPGKEENRDKEMGVEKERLGKEKEDGGDDRKKTRKVKT